MPRWRSASLRDVDWTAALVSQSHVGHVHVRQFFDTAQQDAERAGELDDGLPTARRVWVQRRVAVLVASHAEQRPASEDIDRVYSCEISCNDYRIILL